MSYTPKGRASTTLYELFQAQVGPTASRQRLSGIMGLDQAIGATHFSANAIGRLLPMFRSLNASDPIRSITTVGVGQLIELGCGLLPFKIDNASGNDWAAYWAAKTALGGISDVGISETCVNGVLHLNSISAMQDAPAVASATLVPIYNGTNAPLTFDDVASLATACGTLSTEDEYWTLSDVIIDGVTLKLATGWTFSGLPFVHFRAEGSPYAKYGYVDHGAVNFAIQLARPTEMTDLGLNNIAAYEAASFRLLRCDANGGRRASGDGDILIQADAGALQAGGVQGGPGGLLATGLVLHVHDNGAGTSVQFTRNADA